MGMAQAAVVLGPQETLGIGLSRGHEYGVQ